MSKTKLDEQLLAERTKNTLNGEVNFNLVCEPYQATFEIKDSGIGIPPKDIKQLFTSFHRGSNVKLIPGTGLGLSIVKQ
ncbi:MAG: sensor histidine kinase [Chroococcus sp. CMT-3BRIN-NPC107]|jgi:signal transduction histidine kinase|nr:sensor histidine kinase [Chroococcus sp. CMT-3BRIN-NPC107]